MSGFVHLHLHSEYSLLDGACRIDRLIDTVKGLGQTAVAITDHGVMFGVIDFYKRAQKEGIKPIIGCEVYVAPRTRFDKTHGIDSGYHHLVLLCENNEGYQNLIKLVSRGWTEGFYNKPRIDRELLEKYSGGLIALSACLAGEIPRSLSNGGYEEAKRTALWYRDLFGEHNYYLELQDHGMDEQKKIIPDIIRLSEQTKIPLVSTNDCHYLTRADSRMQHVLLCIQTNKTVDDKSGMEFPTDEFYVKSEEEMRALFPELPQAADNTVQIAERCNVEFTFGETKLPHFTVPNEKDHFTYLKELCETGMQQHFGGQPSKEITDRLDYELGVINTMGYVDYFLIVHDFIHYAKTHGIPVGPGRGSGAGSLVAYLVGITGIDPIKYNLLFERFLNPERVSMPDFDIDFCYEKRQKVIDYVVGKYGEDHVAQIITFGTMAARAAIRDVGRALDIPYATVDAVAKMVPMELGMTLDRALKSSRDLKTQVDTDPKIKELIDMAIKLEGMPRHASTHAAGVVITQNPVDDYVPLQKNDEAIVTQFTMNTLEELGLLKMDFLGLRNLTVIKDTEETIRRLKPDFKIDDISVSDQKVYAMFSSAQTDGVFQFESAGMRNLLIGMKPNCIEDLIAAVSLYRPGPMESIPRYLENRQYPEKQAYKHPILQSILDVTCGCMVYQEQVMQIFREMGGYSLGRADIVRRAMSKKKHDVLQKERETFVSGAVERGVDQTTANKIFDEMSSFASYAFPKAHATAYALLAYQTAYLKCHYPKEYLAALLTSVLDNTGKIAGYIGECSRLKIKVLPPSVNQSRLEFTVAGEDIRFGLLAIKNLGRGVILDMIKEREKSGAYKGLYDLCSRLYGSDLNRRALESLIKCGALDNLGANRRQMLLTLNRILDDLEIVRKRNVEGQVGFFDSASEQQSGTQDYQMPPMEEAPFFERLSMEKETVGLYLSGHPVAEYEETAKAVKSADINELNESVKTGQGRYQDGGRVNLLGVVGAIKHKVTKKGNATMAFVTLEDRFGSIEVIVFPSVLTDYGMLLKEGTVVVISGRISAGEEEDAKIVCDTVELAQKEGETKTPKQKKQGLYLRAQTKESEALKKALKITEIFDGILPLYLYYEDENKYFLAPRNMWVDINEPMLNELKRILGENNVVCTN